MKRFGLLLVLLSVSLFLVGCELPECVRVGTNDRSELQRRGG